jgi:hypothetical protein
MATRIQVRRDTAANWTTSGSTTLAAGEIGFETDTLLFKIGDGSQTWTNLEYAGGTEPIRYNLNGTALADLNDSTVRSGGNGKYLILGAGSVSNGPSGLTTATDGQLLVTVAKFDYTGTSAANERYLMTLQTLTTNRFFYRTYNGSWSSWYEAIRADHATGDVTIAGDLAVNGGDITTTSTGTATVFNTNATTLNVGQAATTVSIGAATGTATINNATTAISGAATVGSTLAVTGNTTLTGDLAVNGGDITTSSATASVFDTTATTLNIGGAATTINVADDVTTAQTINIGTGVTGSGATKTINIGTGGDAGSTTNVNIGDADGGTVAVGKNMTVGGNLTVSGTTTLAGKLATSNLPTKSLINAAVIYPSANIDFLAQTSNQSRTATLSYTPVGSGSTILIRCIGSDAYANTTYYIQASYSGSSTVTHTATISVASSPTTGTISLSSNGLLTQTVTGGSGSFARASGDLVISHASGPSAGTAITYTITLAATTTATNKIMDVVMRTNGWIVLELAA